MPTKVFPFFMHFIRKRPFVMAILLMVHVIASILASMSSFILKVIIDDIANISSGFDIKIVYSLLTFLGVVFIECVFWRWGEFTFVDVIPKIKADIRASVFEYVQGHSYKYFQERLAGNISNKILDISKAFETMISFFMCNCMTCAIIVAVHIAMFFNVHYIFGLIMSSWFVVMVVLSWILSVRGSNLYSEQSEANSTISGRIVDAIKNMLTVRIFSRQRYELQHLNMYQEDEVKKAKIAGRYFWKMHSIQDLLYIVLFVSVISLFAYIYTKGLVSIGDFALLISGLNIVSLTIWMTTSQFATFFKEYGISKQALELITIPHEIEDSPNAKDLQITSGKIEFKNVTFHYIPGKNIFANKNVVINSGEKVGLVGFSGSGKTTFVNLILRHFELEGGQIMIDGNDIRDFSQESLREQIVMIPQDSMLFHRTLMENIKYGKPEASDAEAIEASKLAHCHDFIKNIPEGYDAMVGEGGLKLSGGQRQRIAIARAILKKNTKILILDEATSALDSVTESYIQKSLLQLMKNRTTIVIAHKLSTLYCMDKILVFDDGVIVESGSHENLIRIDGHYSYLWNMQNKGFLPEKKL